MEENTEFDKDKKQGFLSRLDFFKNVSSKETTLKLLYERYTKYLYYLCLFIVLIFFIKGRVKEEILENQIEVIKKKIEKVEQQYRKDSTEYHDLNNTPSLIEHIAREDYYMKEEGEEIYIIKKVEIDD